MRVFGMSLKFRSFLQISRSSAISLNQEEFKILLDLDLLQALKVLASKLQIFTFLLKNFKTSFTRINKKHFLKQSYLCASQKTTIRFITML